MRCFPAHVAVLCCFDCCHSGTLLDLPYGYGGGITLDEPPAARVYMLSGCRDAQKSKDTRLDGQWGGAMTWALRKTLRASPAPSVRGRPLSPFDRCAQLTARVSIFFCSGLQAEMFNSRNKTRRGG